MDGYNDIRRGRLLRLWSIGGGLRHVSLKTFGVLRLNHHENDQQDKQHVDKRSDIDLRGSGLHGHVEIGHCRRWRSSC